MSYMPPKHVKTDRFAKAAKKTAADEGATISHHGGIGASRQALRLGCLC